MKIVNFVTALVFAMAVANTVDAVPPGACTPWPACKEGDDIVTSEFFEACDDTSQWDVTGKWTTSRGECSAKNTDAEHSMTTIADIDLSNKQDAFLTYKYHIDNADAGGASRVFGDDDRP